MFIGIKSLSIEYVNYKLCHVLLLNKLVGFCSSLLRFLLITVLLTSNAQGNKENNDSNKLLKNKTIFFHIGTPKTGTTTLQNFLYHNRSVLEKKHNLYYPIIDQDEYRVITNGSFFNDARFYDSFFEEIAKTNCDRILISEEIMFGSEGINIFSHKELEKYNVKIVFYIRNSVEYLASMWAEQSKLYKKNDHYVFSGYNGQFNEYIELDLYQKSLKGIFVLSKIFGQDNIIVKPYEQERFVKTTLVEDFLSIFDIQITQDFSIPKNQNYSLTRKYCDVMTFLKRNVPSFDYTPEQMDRVMAKVGGDERKVIDTITNEQIKEICDSHADIEEKISKTFYNNSPLFLKKCSSYAKKERAEYTPLTESDQNEILKIFQIKNIPNKIKSGRLHKYIKSVKAYLMKIIH